MRFLKEINRVMTIKYSFDQINAFWTEQAKKHGQSPTASWSDHRIIEMEIREILTYLDDKDRVLDVGCANGYSTIQFAAGKDISIRGVDYIPEMIEQADIRLDSLRNRLMGAAEFGVDNALNLNEPNDTYDKVIVIRVIINLHDWSLQLEGLRECIRVIKPGGLLLLSEATIQGWQRLNALRREWGLADIPIPAFNSYIDKEQLIEAVSHDLELVKVVNFSSTYYIGTRVLKPLLAKLLGEGFINIADPDMECNRWLAQLPAWGDYGTQELFVFKKKHKPQ
jgi:ubiquinone/menaquinone biosynthesis C-methylase UbiE